MAKPLRDFILEVLTESETWLTREEIGKRCRAKGYQSTEGSYHSWILKTLNRLIDMNIVLRNHRDEYALLARLLARKNIVLYTDDEVLFELSLEDVELAKLLLQEMPHHLAVVRSFISSGKSGNEAFAIVRAAINKGENT